LIVPARNFPWGLGFPGGLTKRCLPPHASLTPFYGGPARLDSRLPSGRSCIYLIPFSSFLLISAFPHTLFLFFHFFWSTSLLERCPPFFLLKAVQGRSTLFFPILSPSFFFESPQILSFSFSCPTPASNLSPMFYKKAAATPQRIFYQFPSGFLPGPLPLCRGLVKFSDPVLGLSKGFRDFALLSLPSRKFTTKSRPRLFQRRRPAGLPSLFQVVSWPLLLLWVR